jgi:hypothetical protein
MSTALHISSFGTSSVPRSSIEQQIIAGNRIKDSYVLPCQSFVMSGHCLYGNKCRYIHDLRMKCTESEYDPIINNISMRSLPKRARDLHQDSFFWPPMSKNFNSGIQSHGKASVGTENAKNDIDFGKEDQKDCLQNQFNARNSENNKNANEIMYCVPCAADNQYHEHDAIVYDTWRRYLDFCGDSYSTESNLSGDSLPIFQQLVSASKIRPEMDIVQEDDEEDQDDDGEEEVEPEQFRGIGYLIGSLESAATSVASLEDSREMGEMDSVFSDESCVASSHLSGSTLQFEMEMEKCMDVEQSGSDENAKDGGLSLLIPEEECDVITQSDFLLACESRSSYLCDMNEMFRAEHEKKVQKGKSRRW